MKFSFNQAVKYGLKGRRYNNVNFLINILKKFNKDDKLKSIWNHIPFDNEDIKENINEKNKLHEINIVNRKIQETAAIGYAIDILENILKKEYQGKRTLIAAENNGKDWDALSHSLRVGEELIELLKEGTITLPRKNHFYLSKIKDGKISIDEILGNISSKLDVIETLMKKSNLPDEPDHEKINDFLFEMNRLFYEGE